MNLRAYQIEISHQACDILHKYGMVYLAMEVRTGKTITALETCKLYGARRALFLTKKKAIASIEKDHKNMRYEYDIKITNYEQLNKLSFDFDVVICDEAHCLKGYPVPSLRTQLLKARVKSIPVIYLSGTPTPESYTDIFHQLWISDKSPYRKYRNFYQWAHEYVDIKQVKRGIYTVNDYSLADGERIKKDIALIMLTYSQDQAQFTCEVKEYFHEVIDDVIVEHVKKIFRERIIYFPDIGACVADSPAKLMSKMHQLSSGSCICENGTAIFSYSKIKYIKNRFKDRRIALFYKFQAEKEMILSEYPQATEIPEDFQSGKSNTFISQILSGREGITLHRADSIVMLSIDYAAVSYFQARARLQDLHRETPAEVHWIFTKGGIEKKIYKAVISKRDFTYSYFLRSGAI